MKCNIKDRGLCENNGFIIDYLTMTIKPNLDSTLCKFPNLDMIFKFLNLDGSDFAEIGGRSHYAKCYVSNNISIYEPYESRFNDMGFCITMSGQGLRYYEQVQKDGEFIINDDFWREFFLRFRNLMNEGYSIKCSRIDIALDDYIGDLDLKKIEQSAINGEFVSRFKGAEKFNGILPVAFSKGLAGKNLGLTIAFGSRQSNTYLRFYDKKAEQLGKCQDEKRLRELEALKCWNRMEFEFKGNNAIKIVNAICDCKDFGTFFAEIVNGYIRFINDDDSNRSRCSMKDWWANFIGTVKISRLTVSNLVSYSFEKMSAYFKKCLAPTVYTMLSVMSIDEFFYSVNTAYGRLKHKQKEIIKGNSIEGINGLEALWEALNPIPINERATYCY